MTDECLSKNLAKIFKEKIEQINVNCFSSQIKRWISWEHFQNDAEHWLKNLVQAEHQCRAIQQLIDEFKESVDNIQQRLNFTEQIIDGFMLKHSVDEKLVQKEELKVNFKKKFRWNKFRFFI